VLLAELNENLWMAFATLRANKLRSLLTTLGVVVGTTTVIVIAAFVAGIDTQVHKEIESFGTRSLFIYKFDPAFNIHPTQEERKRKPISYEDGVAMRQIPAVESVAIFQSPTDYTLGPFQERPVVRYRDTEMRNGTVNGVTPDYFRMGGVRIYEGRGFTDAEELRRAKVAVIGIDVANALFPATEPLGKQLQIRGEGFEVVGVLERRENFLTPDDDPNNENRSVYIPYQTVRSLYPERDDNFVMAQAYPSRMEEAAEQIRDLLRKRRGVPYDKPDNFAITTADRIIEQFGQITGGVFALMVAISSVGLLIGGIGVMNIMLVSVKERTREIGIRKAIGARRSDIVWQFLIEAAALTGLGGSIGVLLGWLLSLGVEQILPSYVPVWAPIAGLASSIGIGLIFGLWPAIKAASLDPIEALRYE
jgi:putative ABC transport system permease protein